jgi:hypothetical protein
MLKQVDGAGVAQRMRPPVRRCNSRLLKLTHDDITDGGAAPEWPYRRGEREEDPWRRGAWTSMPHVVLDRLADFRMQRIPGSPPFERRILS